MKKFYIDVTLIVMLIAVMNFHFLPKVLHEIIGVLMAAALIVHIKWNLRALRTLPKIYLTIDALMLIGMTIVMATGVIVSHYLFKDVATMALKRTILIHQLHDSIPFMLMILIGLHLGRNWLGFKQRLIKAIAIEVPSIVTTVILTVFLAIGITGVWMDQLFDRLMMKHIFGTAATQLPFGGYLIIMIGMLTLFTAIGIYFDRLIKKF